ncbi:ArgP/LysG family DNA-binding transcriptional regulator, partial [Acinetobacter baumannii]
GRALLVRSKPIRVTRAGEPVLRLARQIAILTDAAAHELSIEARHAALPIAVNSDSLATWVLPALAPLGEVVAVDIHREDQA